MNKSDYVRRAVAELTGRPVKKQSFNLPFFYILIPAGLLIVLILALVLWPHESATDKNTNSVSGGSDNCAFYITEQGAPTPVTEGDAAQVDTCVQLEAVRDHTTRTLGLSNRKSMAWDHGMIFDFDVPGKYCMWMKDMHFSLDIIWLDEQGKILAMRQNVSPETYPNLFCGPETARYVIEVNEGVVQAGDLHIGQQVNL